MAGFSGEQVTIAFELLKKNTRAGQQAAKRRTEEPSPCSCKPRSQGGQSCSADSQCLNRLSHMECCPASCPCGSECQNQAMQKQHVPRTRKVEMEGKGWGIVADEDILPGSFVMEYIGEIVGMKEAELRAKKYEDLGLKHTYIMDLMPSECIDATEKGGTARFINHSCEPNCTTEKWLVCGELRVGIFAQKRIPAGDEITYHYRLDWNRGERVKCLCGAAKCHGFLGAHAASFKDDGHYWQDADGEQYLMDTALDTYDSDPEQQEPADAARPSIAAASADPSLDASDLNSSGSGRALAPTTAGTDSEAVDTAQPARQAALAGRRIKKKKGGRKPGPKPKHAAAAAGATAAGATMTSPADYYGILELDDDFVLEASSSGACKADVTQMPAWACTAGKIRLLARQQAQHSAAAAQSSEIGAETEQQLAFSAKSAQMEQQEMPGEVPADGIGRDSIAKAKGMLAEFDVLHTKILSWV